MLTKFQLGSAIQITYLMFLILINQVNIKLNEMFTFKCYL
jgi:hypothetical protein